MNLLGRASLVVMLGMAFTALLGGCGGNPTAANKISSVTVPQKTFPKAVRTGKTELWVYIIQLQDAPLATFAAGGKNATVTNPKITGAQIINLDSQANHAYVRSLAAQHKRFLDSLGHTVGRTVTPVFSYYYAMNGMAVRLTPGEAVQAAKLPGVISVRRDTAHRTLPASEEDLN